MKELTVREQPIESQILAWGELGRKLLAQVGGSAHLAALIAAAEGKLLRSIGKKPRE